MFFLANAYVPRYSFIFLRAVGIYTKNIRNDWTSTVIELNNSVADPGFGQGRGQPAKEGPQALAGPSSCDGPPRDLRAREGHLRLQTLRGPTMSSEGPFGLLRGPLQTLRGPPYELRGSLRRSVNPFRGHQNTC